jgi:diaminohydroxyphosphoribosylaminopyrimidine deaminase/5-amino-6-(5-phosphoribosylamino)uracil reductase
MLTDADYMARALFLAERGRGRTSPNPIVGAVVVSPDGVVVGAGYHERAGEAHAEVRALDTAGPRARGATLYCTLEPCCHVGRTGPCTSRIVEAGVRRVVAAVGDPNPHVGGGGFRRLRQDGVEVVEGVLADAAARANAAFFTWIRRGRPFVTMKVAISADGRVAERPGVRSALTGAAAARLIHRDRAAVDAVGVGSGTVLADDPLLTARGAWRERPLTRVVFDRRLRTPPAARLFSTLAAGPVIILTRADAYTAAADRVRALERAGARVEAVAGTIEAALRRLGALGLTSLTLEGGPALHTAAWTAGVVDFVQIYVAARALSAGGVPWLGTDVLPSSTLASASTRWCGDDLLIEAHVHRID